MMGRHVCLLRFCEFSAHFCLSLMRLARSHLRLAKTLEERAFKNQRLKKSVDI